jgi:glycosyltransferase involved in cell wall biosynthesis
MGKGHANRETEKRALFVTSTSEVYGGELSLLPVVRNLGPSWKAHFVVERAGPLDKLLRNEGFPVHRLSVDTIATPTGRVGRALRLIRLLYLLYSRRIQLVHVNLHYHAPLVSRACSFARIPIVVHVRNMIDQPAATEFRKYDGIICISQAVQNSLATQGKVPLSEIAERLWIVPDGRELAPFYAGKRERLRKELGLDPATSLVGMAARITSMKGQDVFLQMAALVKRRVANVRFLLVGATPCKDDEEYSQGLRGLVAELGLQKEVIFAGYRDDMPDVLAAMDCFAHPSRHGAFVSVLIEAMASGLPIVASNVDGIPECVGREGSAVLLPPDDPAEWADAVLRILEDNGLASRMGEKGKERAARLFEITPLACLTAEALEAVYRCYPRGANSLRARAAQDQTLTR